MLTPAVRDAGDEAQALCQQIKKLRRREGFAGSSHLEGKESHEAEKVESQAKSSFANHRATSTHKQALFFFSQALKQRVDGVIKGSGHPGCRFDRKSRVVRVWSPQYLAQEHKPSDMFYA